MPLVEEIQLIIFPFRHSGWQGTVESGADGVVAEYLTGNGGGIDQNRHRIPKVRTTIYSLMVIFPPALPGSDRDDIGIGAGIDGPTGGHGQV